MVRRVLLLAGVGLLTMGCEEQERPAKAPEKPQAGVPANSLSDARMRGEEDPKDRMDREEARSKEQRDDPTMPYTTKVGEAPAGSTGTSAGKTGSTAGSGRGGGGAGGKGAVSRAECDQVMDRYLELEISTNPQLKGVPPEVVEQAKQMARDKHGESPCTATRAQYACAMAATTTAAWQKCMK